MRRFDVLLTGCLLGLGVTALAGPTVIEMGDGHVNGNAVQPYEFTWRQCSKQGENWVDGRTLTERAAEVEEGGRRYLRHEQESVLPNGGRTVAVTYFERASLAPRRMEAHVYAPDGTETRSASYTLGLTGYTGRKVRDGVEESVEGDANSAMYHGMAFGLVLAMLDLDHALPAELPASMLAYDATYRVIATSAGRTTLRFADGAIDAWLVDVEWHHRELGDVYPPGPDASGGRYWLVPEPPEGFPYVPRYQTDTFAVEFLPEVCPRSHEAPG